MLTEKANVLIKFTCNKSSISSQSIFFTSNFDGRVTALWVGEDSSDEHATSVAASSDKLHESKVMLSDIEISVASPSNKSVTVVLDSIPVSVISFSLSE